jgi:lysozyme
MAVPYQPTYTLNPKYGFRYGPSTFGPTTTNLTSPPPVGLDGSSAAPPPVMGSQEGQYNQNLDGGSDYLQDQQTQQQNQARITQAQSYGYTQGVQNPSSLLRAVPVVGNFIADSIPSNAKYNYGTSGTYDAEGNVFDSSGRAYNPITGAPAQSYSKATGEDSWLGNWIGFGTKEGMFGPSSSYGKLRSAGEDPINSFFGSYDNSVYKQMDANPNLSIQGAREARRRGFASPIENLTFDITQNTMNAQTDEFGNLPTGPVWGTNTGDYVQSDQGPLQVTESGQLKGPDGFTTVMIDGVSFVNTDIRDYGNLTDAQKAVVDNRTSVDDNTYSRDPTPGNDIFSTPSMDSGTVSTPDPSPFAKGGEYTPITDLTAVSTPGPSIGYQEGQYNQTNDDPWGGEDNTNSDNTNSASQDNNDAGMNDYGDGDYNWSRGGEIPAELSIDNIKNMGNMMNVKKYSQKDRYGNEMSVEFYDVPDMKVPDHPGGPKGTDTVPAWLTPGEFVMNAEATRMFEPQIEQMNNAGRSVQAQQGGTIPEYAAHGKPIYAAAGGNSGFLADILKRLEGVKDEAYLDSAGKPTIGAGSTRGVQMGDTASDEQIDSRLAEDIAVVDQDYGQLVTADLNPNQEAAVKSLLFNIGGPQFANSKARAALNAGDFDSFKKEAAEFRKVGDEVIPGLENRRAQELALFDSPVGEDPWGINRRQVSTRDDRVSKLNAAAQPTDLAMQAAILGQDAETAGEIVTPPPIDRGAPSPMSMVSPEDQRRMQQGQVPPMIGAAVPPKPTDDPLVSTVPPSNTSRDDRVDVLNNAAKGGNTVIGTLQGNDVYQDDLGEYINTPEGPVYLDGNQLQAMTKAPPSVTPSSTVPVIPPSNTSRDDRVAKLTDAATVPGASSNTEVPLPDDDIFSTPAMSTDPTASMLARQQALNIGPQDFKQPDVNVTLNQGEYGVNDTIIREDANGNPITYKWDSSKDSYVDDDGLEYNRTLSELASGLFKKGEPDDGLVTDATPGDTNIGTYEGYPVYMGKNGKPYVVKPMGPFDTGRTTQLQLLPFQTDDIVKLPESERTVAPPRSDPNKGKDKDGLIPLPMDTSIPDELSGTPMDSSSGVPKLEEAPPKPKEKSSTTGMDDEYDEDLDSTTKEILKRITSDDGTTTGQTPAAATEAGNGAPKEDVNKAESFLSGIFGDLFDKDELKRMAIMYVGSRLMGGSHNGSMNFAAKQYINRVDAKSAEKKAEDKALAKEKRLDLKAARKEFNKNLFDLNKDPNISKASIQAYKKSYDPKTGTADSSLLEQRVKPTPMNIDGNPELYYPIDGGKPVLGQKIKTGTKETGFSTMIVDQAGNPLKTYLMHQDKSRIPKTPEFNKRVVEESGRYEKMMEDLIKDNTSTENGKEIRPTDLRPSLISGDIAKWAIKNDVDPNDMGQIIRTAYESMKAENIRDPKVRHSNITKFLDGAYIPAMVGDPQLFNVPGTNSPGDLQEISKLSSTLVAKARASKMKGISNKSDNEVKDHIYKQFAREFKGEASYDVPDPSTGGMKTITLDEDMMKDFIEEAKKSNTSPFQLFIAQRLREPVKPK